MPFLSNFTDILQNSVSYTTSEKLRKKYVIKPKDIYYDGVEWVRKKRQFQELHWVDSSSQRELVEILFDLIIRGWFREDIFNHGYIVFESAGKPYYSLENVNLESPNSNQPVLLINLDPLLKTSWISKYEEEKRTVAKKRKTVLGILASFLVLGFLNFKN